MLSFANSLDTNTSKYAFYIQNQLVSSTTEVPMLDCADFSKLYPLFRKL